MGLLRSRVSHTVASRGTESGAGHAPEPLSAPDQQATHERGEGDEREEKTELDR